jgi:hypothetical protein
MTNSEVTLDQLVYKCVLESPGIPAELWKGIIVPHGYDHEQSEVKLVGIFSMGNWWPLYGDSEAISGWSPTSGDAIHLVQKHYINQAAEAADRLSTLLEGICDSPKAPAS